MITDIQPIERTLGTFLANTEYGIWQYCRNRVHLFPSLIGIYGELIGDDCTFAEQKARIEEKIEAPSYLGLVSSHLFPQYDDYERVLSRYLDSIQNTMWEGPIMIPKSRACPTEGSYFLAKIELPKNLFDDITGRFFEQFECRIIVIRTNQCDDMFWQNLDLNFYRKQTLSSWNGRRLERVSGSVTTVVSESGKTCKGTIIPAVMSLLLRSWTEVSLLHETPSYRWTGTTLGRGRYRKNIEDLMTDSCNDCLKDIGTFLNRVHEISYLVSEPEMISITDVEPEISSMPPVSAVDYAIDVLKHSEGYRKLEELELLLCSIFDSLDMQNPKVLCDMWNRCVKQKVDSTDDIRALIVSKYISVRDDILTILSMRPLFHLRTDPRLIY